MVLISFIIYLCITISYLELEIFYAIGIYIVIFYLTKIYKNYIRKSVENLKEKIKE
jgi:hypothetical protein